MSTKPLNKRHRGKINDKSGIRTHAFLDCQSDSRRQRLGPLGHLACARCWRAVAGSGVKICQDPFAHFSFFFLTKYLNQTFIDSVDCETDLSLDYERFVSSDIPEFIQLRGQRPPAPPHQPATPPSHKPHLTQTPPTSAPRSASAQDKYNPVSLL